MTERKSVSGKSIRHFLYAALSLFMAAVLFAESPVQAHAAAISGAHYSVSVSVAGQPVLCLHDRTYLSSDVGHVVMYRGTFTVFYQIRYPSGYGLSSGVCSIHQSFQISYGPVSVLQPVGSNFSIVNVSAPEGVSVSMVRESYDSVNIAYEVFFSFDNVRCTPDGRVFVSVTYDAYSDFYKNAQGAVQDTIQVNVIDKNTAALNSGSFYNNYADYDYWANWIMNYSTAMHNRVDNIMNSVNRTENNIVNWSSAILSKLEALISSNSKDNSDIINAANQNSKNEIDAANKNADDIMNSYDSSSQDTDNGRFDASQKELQATEDSLFGDASKAFDDLDFQKYGIGSVPGIVSAMSFVSGFLQSLYVKMGVFGTIVTTGMVVLIASKVIGLFRFSTDGGGKGG